MTREQFLDLDDWTLVNVLCRPNRNEEHPERGYWPVERWDPAEGAPEELSPAELFLRHWRRHGLDDQAIAERYHRWRNG